MILDWADEEAEKIVDEVREHRWSPHHDGNFRFDLRTGEAIELVATRLRLVRLQGEAGGLEEAIEALKALEEMTRTDARYDDATAAMNARALIAKAEAQP